MSFTSTPPPTTQTANLFSLPKHTSTTLVTAGDTIVIYGVETSLQTKTNTTFLHWYDKFIEEKRKPFHPNHVILCCSRTSGATGVKILGMLHLCNAHVVVEDSTYYT